MNMGQRIDHLIAKGAGICIALFGGMVLVNLPSFYESEVDFQSKAIRATVTVVKTRVETQHYVNITYVNVSTSYISTVKFQTNQAQSVEFTTTKACSSGRDCENKTVSVLYDPSRHSDARVDSGATPESQLKGSLMFSVVLLLLGIFMVVLEPTDGTQLKKKPQ